MVMNAESIYLADQNMKSLPYNAAKGGLIRSDSL